MSIRALKLVALWSAVAAGNAGAAGSGDPVAPAHAQPTSSGPANAGKVEPAPTLTVTVTNPLGKARARETLSVSLADVLGAAPGFDVKKAQIVDAAGKEVLSQLVDMNGDGEPDELVFQTDLAGKQSKTFKLKAGQRQPAARDAYKVYGRFVRERHDDFAWENDLVAHRMYGPDLETYAKEPLTSSGVDVWVKRVPTLVVNDWYMTDNYHHDAGEGADFYSVGKSRGLGGLGVWAGGKLHVSKNFTHSRVLANGPIRLVFELAYAPWDAGGTQVGETKRIVLDAGTEFNRFESTFAGQQGTLAIGVGIAEHPGSTAKTDARTGWMRVWEPLDGGKAGNLGTALVFPAGTHLQQRDTDLDYLVVSNVARGRLVYYAGSAWDRAGKIRDKAAWAAEVESFASRLAAPVKVSLRAGE
jgi:unsaturated rhamnogalacturonyl hydrolase